MDWPTPRDIKQDPSPQCKPPLCACASFLSPSHLRSIARRPQPSLRRHRPWVATDSNYISPSPTTAKLSLTTMRSPTSTEPKSPSPARAAAVLVHALKSSHPFVVDTKRHTATRRSLDFRRLLPPRHFAASPRRLFSASWRTQSDSCAPAAFERTNLLQTRSATTRSAHCEVAAEARQHYRYPPVIYPNS